MEEQTPETAPEEQPTQDPQAPPPPPGPPEPASGAVPESTVNDGADTYTPSADVAKQSEGAVQLPTVGRIVHYTLSRQDAEHANRRRTTPQSIRDRTNAGTWSVGAQAHIGSEVREGQILPMVVVVVCYPGDGQGRVNGQVCLDGNDVLYVSSRPLGTAPGTWAWPPRS
jgi:hypothetical protein